MKSFEDLSILIVDDEEMISQLLVDYFAENGAKVISAKNGVDALELLEKEHFNVILSDVRMPGLSGVDFVKKIPLNVRDKVNIYFLSGFNDVTQDELERLKIKKMINKPFNLKDIFKAIVNDLSA